MMLFCILSYHPELISARQTNSITLTVGMTTSHKNRTSALIAWGVQLVARSWLLSTVPIFPALEINGV